jgi:hypothetical protein
MVPGDADAGIDAIRAADPSFSASSFLTQVERSGGLLVTG